MNELVTPIDTYAVYADVTNALREDLNNFPDWTAQLVDPDKTVNAYIKTNQDAVICGCAWVDAAFCLNDPQVAINWRVQDGDKVKPGDKLCTIQGKSQALLTAERTALNFLQTLSATATLTAQYIVAIKNTNAVIMDTRKTIPGLRRAQKYAVQVGGGKNQRIGLFDGVLIKENHIIAHGGITQVMQHALKSIPAHIPIQIEVETFDELQEAIASGATLILLDNMQPEQIRECVAYCQGKHISLEVSGNVNLENVREYALCGIERISIGALTKNIQAIDLSMRFTTYC